MNIKEKIIQYLINHKDGIDDDELASQLNLRRRQQANHYCRELETEGLVSRKKVNGKIHNFWIGNKYIVPQLIPNRDKNKKNSKLNDWFWEGNVQASVIAFLVNEEYRIISVADTEKHERGVDIIAQKNEIKLWISVKGYPTGTQKTNPSVQAGHYFKDVVFDMIKYREENKDILLGIALPDFPRYRNLAKEIAWFKEVAGVIYFWVSENGMVNLE